MPFLPEPLFQHGQPDRTAILLVNPRKARVFVADTQTA